MFELEKAVERWKKTMRKNRAIQDGDLAELEAYLLDKIEDLVGRGMGEEAAFKAAQDEFGEADRLDADFYRVHTVRMSGRPPWQAPRFVPALLWNYVKIGLRKIRRQMATSFLAVLGLALGLACCVLTVIWVQYEYSFDRAHRNLDSLYRVITINTKEKTPAPAFGAPLPLGPALAAEYPEVANYSMYRRDLVENGIRSDRILDRESRVAFVEPAFFAMFDFPFQEGNPETALRDVDSVLVTESAAKKFFGDDPPLGKTLLFFDQKIPMRVTAILKDVPENSHIQFDLVVHGKAIGRFYGQAGVSDIWNLWWLNTHDLYLQLGGKVAFREFERKIQECLRRNDPTTSLVVRLQPLKDVHLRSGFEAGYRYQDKKWNAGTVNLFLFISLAVLLVAGINVVNLSTARSLKRAKEVGIRKVTGAGRMDIIRQALTESLLLAFLALAAALALAAVLLPVLRELTGRRLDLHLLDKGRLALSLFGLTAATGLLSGLYPALFVSSFAPVKAMKNALGKSRASFLLPRRILLSIQFLSSTVLLIITAVFILQMDYTRRRDLGYRRENIVVLPRVFTKEAAVYKSELLKDPHVLSVTQSAIPAMTARGHVFKPEVFDWKGKAPDDKTSFDVMFVDEDYLGTYGLSLAAGRFFSKDFSGDAENVVLNETAARAMGTGDPVGRAFELKMFKRKGQVIGVVRDFHTSTLRAPIRPTVFIFSTWGYTSVRIAGRDVEGTIRHIEGVTKKFDPERSFSYVFLADKLAALYAEDRKIARIITGYGLLALLIAGLGLVGLVAIVAEQKTKEIGIRKVLGASASSIIGLISWEFLALVGVSSLLAWPLGYLIASDWLRGFAYKIGLSIWIFAAATVFVLAFTLLTTAGQSLRAAGADPVDCLRYE